MIRTKTTTKGFILHHFEAKLLGGAQSVKSVG